MTNAAEQRLSREEAHTCHARGCEAHVPPVMLMCKRHWFMVPRAIRLRVWAFYRPGQCDLDPMPSREWVDASIEAVNAVAEREKNSGATP